MDEQKVFSLIEQYMIGNQFRVGPIPFHTHNNIDSPAFPFSNISNANQYAAYNKITLTPSQVKALHTTPITLVPSQGGSKSIIIVDDILAFLNYAGTAYTGANNLEFRYTDGSGTKVTADMSSTFLDSAANAYDYAPGVTTAFTPVTNTPIVVAVPVANPAAGTSPITFIVHYRVLAF